jgi:hypothetical protein
MHEFIRLLMNSKVTINGHIVSYDDSTKQGIYYLMHLIDAKEQKVFFDQAFSHGFAFFEDQRGGDYKLVHHGSEYQLVKG